MTIVATHQIERHTSWGNLNWHDIDTFCTMMQFLKHLLFDNESEVTGFKMAPAFIMVLLFLLFQASIIYVLLSTMLNS